MKWIIKNPAPTDWRQEKWGDFHFGRCLTKYLRRLGQEVKTNYYPEWENEETTDVILVLRGKYPYIPKKNSKIHIMWNVSHPELVPLKEYDLYDMVFVASNFYANKLKDKIAKPVYPLLQCTDIGEFYIKDFSIDQYRKDIIFVGNTREVERPCVIWAEEYGLPIKIWGRGWTKWIDKKHIVGQYIENKQLRNLYCSARVTLNDHWPDMLKYGFINNRIFDALACGLPVISDFNMELFKLFPDEILYYKNKNEFINCIEKYIMNYPDIKSKVNSIIPRINKEFSFQSRAKILLEKSKELYEKYK